MPQQNKCSQLTSEYSGKCVKWCWALQVTHEAVYGAWDGWLTHLIAQLWHIMHFNNKSGCAAIASL
jgi:hypothetical protein